MTREIIGPCRILFLDGQAPDGSSHIKVRHGYGVRLTDVSIFPYKRGAGQSCSKGDTSPPKDHNLGWNAQLTNVVRIVGPKERLLWENKKV